MFVCIKVLFHRAITFNQSLKPVRNVQPVLLIDSFINCNLHISIFMWQNDNFNTGLKYIYASEDQTAMLV